MPPSPSRRSLALTLNGKTYHVEIGDLDSSPLDVRVDGETYQVMLGDIDSEAAPVPAREGTAAASAAFPPGAPAPATATYSAQEIRSPMPGNILDIAVSAGERVEVGQPLCALEAMKMKSTIRSPREGVISAVAVTEGQVVVHGELLFSFE